MAAWMPVAQARRALIEALGAVRETEIVPLEQALTRVLAHDVTAERPVPAQVRSAMDGYALRWQDLQGKDCLPVGQRIPAGRQPLPLHPGTCARIFTGAVVPEGADTVVMQEDTRSEGECVYFHKSPTFGAHIHAIGHDVAAGQQVLAAGRRLGAVELSVLAMLGAGEVVVRRRPRVVLLSTGDELLSPGQTWRPAAIYDSNRPLIASVLRQWGLEVVTPPHVADERAATRTALLTASDLAPDLIMSSGGVSVGEEDHIQALLQAEGEMAFWKVALRPGKPLCLARWQGLPYIGLPGNPLSALVTLTLVCRDALLGLCGQAAPHWQGQRVRSAFARRLGERDEILAAQPGVDGWSLATHLSSAALWPTLQSLAWVGLHAHQDVAVGDEIDLWSVSDLLSTRSTHHP